jgi:hypothetical protein
LKGVRAIFRLVLFVAAVAAAGRADLLHVMANSGWSWHLFAAPAIWIGSLRGKPVVVNYRGGEAEPFLMQSAGPVRASMKRGSLVLPSGFLQDVFGRFGMKGRIVSNIIDPPVFGLPMTGVLLPRISWWPAILRQFMASKRPSVPLPKFRWCGGCALSVAGSGPQLAELQALAVRLGVADQGTLPGVWTSEMASLYRDADPLNPSRVDNTNAEFFWRRWPAAFLS